MESIIEKMESLSKLAGGSISLAVAGPSGVSDGRLFVASYSSSGAPYIAFTSDRHTSPDEALRALSRQIASSLRDLGRKGQQLAEAAERLGL